MTQKRQRVRNGAAASKRGNEGVEDAEPSGILPQGGLDRIASWEVEEPHVTAEEDTVESAFERVAPSVSGPLVARLIPLSTGNTGLSSIDIHRDVGDMILGRSKELVVECRIDVALVSARHCELTVNPTTRSISIRDVSTNGTFINGNRIEKNVWVELHSGDRVFLTHPANASQPDASSVGFLFQSISEKIRADVLQEELTCPVCKGLYVRPCSILPCLHVFCAGCVSRWIDAGNRKCIQCRSEVWEVRPTHKLQSCVEELLKTNPELSRTSDELAELVAFDTIPPRGRVVKKRRRYSEDRSDDDDYSSLDSTSESDDGANIGQGSMLSYDASGHGHTRSIGRCQQCRRASREDGFRCRPDGLHLHCPMCYRSFPHRPLCPRPQCCQLCGASYCNLYYQREGGCPANRGGLTRLRQCPPRSTLPQKCFGGNAVEQNIISRYLSAKGITLETVWKECLEKMEAGEWVPDITCVNGQLTVDSPLCEECINSIFASLLFHYRRAVPNYELPESVTDRPSCWYGINCRTQFHKAEHANRYNHVCYQEKRKE
ncbi:zinc finger family protein [Trypanosoma rangeli]|uniref:E3 ubiquitin-protein ligase CHFR n=1 Tax=Trypanosoma rangeli TaxID=5698 RepID=A0A3R7MDE3_TRYRA|nr:zinc finger family protein [Trypanosoma rangeli]RNF03756.1 zinc finger family protein [Trypanosoma rangeli]|eukprot:RNF03756.1 zinc finger family protein [Trypanosoma rangeli]